MSCASGGWRARTSNGGFGDHWFSINLILQLFKLLPTSGFTVHRSLSVRRQLLRRIEEVIDLLVRLRILGYLVVTPRVLPTNQGGVRKGQVPASCGGKSRTAFGKRMRLPGSEPPRIFRVSGFEPDLMRFPARPSPRNASCLVIRVHTTSHANC